MAFIAPIAGLVGLAGSFMSAQGTIAGANAQAAGLQYQAQVARQKGLQDKATAQRNALESARKTQLALSTLQARSAGSGAGASDPTVVGLASDIAGRGEYQGLLQMWQGNIKNWDYQTDAIGKEATASAVQEGAKASALGTILGGAGSLFKSFAGGPFGSLSSSTLPNSGYNGYSGYTGGYTNPDDWDTTNWSYGFG